jgi:thiol-disulfide isomerase/thioredoxin
MKLARVMAAAALLAFIAFAHTGARAETAAAQALKVVSDDLKAKSQTMSPYEYAGYAEKALLDFLKTYPKGPEAAQAHFALGRLYSSIGAPESAATHMSAFLAEPGEKGGPNMAAQARYVLGESYMALDRYDDAERAFREITAAGTALDSRIVEAASSELVRIPALKRLKIGAPAVAISAKSFQGKRIELPKGYQGKVVLLDFWAAWCNPCRMEMPNVIKVYNELHPKGFEIVGISLDKEQSEFEKYLQDNNIAWQQLYDGKYWQSEYARLYAVQSIPATFLLDRKGIIRFKNVRGEELRQAVLKLLAEK